MTRLMRNLPIAVMVFAGCTPLVYSAAGTVVGAQCGDFNVSEIKLLTISDMTTSDRNAFLQLGTASQPGCVIADINGDGIQDAALIGKTEGSGTAILVVGIARRDGGFKSAFRMTIGKSLEGIYLMPHAATTAKPSEAFDSSAPTQTLKHDAIDLVFIEKATVTYYWDERAGKIASVQTAD